MDHNWDDGTLRQIAAEWLRGFEAALSTQDGDAFGTLFAENSYWRDLAAMTWDTCQFWGREAVKAALFERAKATNPRGMRIAKNRTKPRVVTLRGTEVIEFFFDFQTDATRAGGFVRVLPDPTSPWRARAQVLGTMVTGLTSAPEPPVLGHGYEAAHPGETWAEFRRRWRASCAEPDVLIVGGGQSGLALGARLDARGVSYAIVERNARSGDSWRNRYASLALHTPTCVNSLPFVRLPDNFPTFLSKDQWADWIDAYAAFMDLNVWYEHEFQGAAFDEETSTWVATVRLPDGGVKTVRPRHIVVALGWTGAEPVMPTIAGLDSFAGEVLHSSSFGTGKDYTGKAVLVIGTSTSGHDIALDLANHNADVTMLQRGGVAVVPISEAERYNLDYEDPAISVDEADQRRNSGYIKPLLFETAKLETARTEQEYAAMYEGLRAAGLELTIGADRTGWLGRLHRTFNGYYLDVGASQAIIDGRIKIARLADAVGFEPSGLRMKDGRLLELDAVICATGFANTQVLVSRLFGEEIGLKIGPVGGVGEDGEHRNLARPTAQRGLWLIFGGIMDARKMSDILALQIQAQLNGDVPSLERGPDGRVREVVAARSVVS